MDPFAPETAFLIHCADPRKDLPATSEASQSLAAALNWDLVPGLASRHGLSPWLWKTCEGSEYRHIVPANVLEGVRKIGRARAYHNHLQAVELLNLVGACSSEGITLIPFKGPALAEYLWGETWLRESIDLDFIVHPADVAKTFSLLSTLGFFPSRPLSKVQELSFVKTHTAMIFRSRTSPVIIDLHWGLTWRSRPSLFNINEVRERLQTTTLLGRPVPWPAPEDLIIALSVNYTKDKWKKLSAVLDVARLVEQYREISWPRVLSRADRWGAGIMVRLGLLLAAQIFGVGHTEGLDLITVSWNRARALLPQAGVALAHPDREDSDDLDRSVYYLKTMQRNAHRAAYVLHVIAHPGLVDRIATTPEEIDAAPFRVRRFWGLIGSGLTAVLRAARGKGSKE